RPKEIFLHLPSEWFIQTDHMIWKYRLVLWIENHLIKEIITIKRLRKWLRKEIERKEIIFYKIQKIHEELLLKVIMEFITLLVQQDILKRRSKGKWLYQKPLKRYKNLNEKYK
ncbi:MAG: hypothetical protein L0I79_04750, partial [Atopostipes sp.]|nr:hypothetical protein [Atopostipes sp.]